MYKNRAAPLRARSRIFIPGDLVTGLRYNKFMSQRSTVFIEGEFYHLYNRGNSKQLIFHDDEDRDRFTKLLYLCNSDKNFDFRDDIVNKKIDAFDFERDKQIIAIGAWVLMPNHFHLYVTIHPGDQVTGMRNPRQVNAISSFMEKLCKTYSRYFNKKYDRTGTLFEGKFKSVHIENDNQAKYLFSYIHLNPVKLIQKDWKEKGIRDVDDALNYLNGYEWGSYFDFKGTKRPQNRILDIEKFPKYFPNEKTFDNEILDWITPSR